MPLVQAKCTNCGASLEVDNAKEAAICPYCQTPYVVEKAIVNFNINNTIKADVVNMIVNESEFVVRGGKLVKYNGESTVVTIPNNVIIIGVNAFANYSGINKVIIPEGVTTIEDGAFSGCTNLLEVNLPKSIKNVGEGVFSGCSNVDIIFSPEITKIPGYLFSKSEIETYTIPENITEIGEFAFSNCYKLRKVVIPESVTSIGTAAFSVTKLESIIIPSKVKTTGINTFYSCMKLNQVVLNEGLEEIGAGAFSCCDSLIQIHLPDSVTYIRRDAFAHDANLTTVRFSPNLKRIEKDAFVQCYNLKNYTIPNDTIIEEQLGMSLKKGSHGGGCYIATCVYGSYDCPQVWTLRRYRDNHLAKTRFGRAFIKIYYAISPTIVKWFGETFWFRSLWKGVLDKKVTKLNEIGFEDTPYNDPQY